MNGNRKVFWLSCFVGIMMGISTHRAEAQFQPTPDAGSALSIPADHLIQPQRLNDLLQASKPGSTLVLQVGSRLLFQEAHIPGSEYVGPGGQPAGLELLRKRVASLAKDQPIVLYCGCCPWERCPNVARAYAALREMGFNKVKVLYIANNFGADWVARGYRVEKGQ
jgi:rhodanese-related sulfurtransferase